jgi:molybdate-binding protein
MLLDGRLAVSGVKPKEVKGYAQEAASHFEVARSIVVGQADAGVGVWSAAKLLGLDFIPLQEERYDLVLPTPYLTSHPGLSNLLDTIVSRAFRTEIEALGGYDTRETGKVQTL